MPSLSEDSASQKRDVAPAPMERRVAPRQPVDKPVEIELVGPFSTQHVPARIADLSATGIGVRLSRPLAPGKQFLLSLSGAVGAVTSFLYRVVRCKPLGGGQYHIGASFVRVPTKPQGSAARANAGAAADSETPPNA